MKSTLATPAYFPPYIYDALNASFAVPFAIVEASASTSR